MGDGSYVGILTKLDSDEIVISELSHEGKRYDESWWEPQIQHWDWSHPRVAVEALDMGLEMGDRVEVHVEFENYKAFRVEAFDWNARKLHERLLRIEKHLGLES